MMREIFGFLLVADRRRAGIICAHSVIKSDFALLVVDLAKCNYLHTNRTRKTHSAPSKNLSLAH